MSLLNKIQSFLNPGQPYRVVIPFKSVGNLLFTDSRQQIRAKLDENFESGVNEFDGLKEYYDYFGDSEIEIVYDEQHNVNAFEFYKSPLVFDGADLLAMPFADLLKMISEIDPGLTCNAAEFSSNKFGIGGNAAYDDHGNITTAEAVIVFKQGYYDALPAFIDALAQ